MKKFRLNSENSILSIPVSIETMTRFEVLFVRKAPTPRQQKQYKTVTSLMRYAYEAGRRDSLKN